MRRGTRGMLIELLVWPAVYGILAAILLPSYAELGGAWRLGVVLVAGALTCCVLAMRRGVTNYTPGGLSYLMLVGFGLSGLASGYGLLIVGLAPLFTDPVHRWVAARTPQE